MTLSWETALLFVVVFFVIALFAKIFKWAFKTIIVAALLLIGLYFAFSLLGINPFGFFK